jgi:hypothetical protein
VILVSFESYIIFKFIDFAVTAGTAFCDPGCCVPFGSPVPKPSQQPCDPCSFYGPCGPYPTCRPPCDPCMPYGTCAPFDPRCGPCGPCGPCYPMVGVTSLIKINLIHPNRLLVPLIASAVQQPIPPKNCAN